MGKKTYSEKLKDPRWQRKRLEIFNRAGFKCEECKEVDKTLHVHHRYYEKGVDPWDYPDNALQSLCEECHAAAAEQEGRIARSLSWLDREKLEQVWGYIQGLKLQNDDGYTYLTSEMAVQGLADAFNVGNVDAVLGFWDCETKITNEFMDDIMDPKNWGG